MTRKRREILGTVSASVITAVAGCANTSNTGGQPETAGQSETAEQSATEQSVSPEDVEYPEGYSEDGIESWEKAKQTHRDALGDQSYTLQETTESHDFGSIEKATKVEPSDEEVYKSRSMDVYAYDPDNEEHQDRYWYITDKAYVKTVDDGGDTRYYVDDGKSFEDERYGFLWEYFTIFEFTLEDVSTHDGEVQIRYTSDELTESGSENFDDKWGDTRSAGISMSVDGLIRKAGILIGEVGETEKFAKVGLTIKSVDETTANKPNWVEEAKASSSS